MTYQHLLVAVDTSEHMSALISKAQTLAKELGSRLSVLSVLVPMPIDVMPADIGLSITTPTAIDPLWYEKMREQAQAGLTAICTPLGIAETQIHLVMGSATSGILDSARELDADLVVIGHRQHQGISGWFTHTDEKVVGRAVCDVLTIMLESTAAE